MSEIIVELNVGGKIFTTYKKTLLSKKYNQDENKLTYFDHLFNNTPHRQLVNAKKNYYIC
jgi:hypothetical protein